MNTQSGSMTIWAMGMSMLLFGIGFLALDLWSGFAARQDAATVADAAAIAGATALDETAWRNGTLALDPATAEKRAATAALRHPAWDPAMTVTVSATTGGVAVTVTRQVPFRFIAALIGGRAATVAVSGYAIPATGS